MATFTLQEFKNSKTCSFSVNAYIIRVLISQIDIFSIDIFANILCYQTYKQSVPKVSRVMREYGIIV